MLRSLRAIDLTFPPPGLQPEVIFNFTSVGRARARHAMSLVLTAPAECTFLFFPVSLTVGLTRCAGHVRHVGLDLERRPRVQVSARRWRRLTVLKLGAQQRL